MASKFRLNPNAEKRIDRMARPMRDGIAEAAADYGRAIAPVLTGRYRDSLKVETDAEAARVVAEVDYAGFVEARDNVLGRSLVAARRDR